MMQFARSSKACLAAAAILGASFLAACGSDSGSSESQSDKVLVVATFGGPAKEAVDANLGEAFRKATGAKVEYVEGNPASFRAQLMAQPGSPPFDVVHLGPVEEKQLAKAGMLEKLDYGDIPNAGAVSPKLLKSDYMAAVDLYEVGIGYDSKKFEEQGLKKPESVTDLFQPGLKGRVAYPELGVVMSPIGMVAMASANGGGERDIEPGFEYLSKQDVQYFYPSSSELATRVTTGEVWAAWWHAGWPPRLVAEVPGMTFASAKIGSHTGFGNYTGYAIPDGAKEADLAKTWIDLALDPEIQAAYNSPQYVMGTTAEARKIQIEDPDFPLADEWLDEDHVTSLYFMDSGEIADEIDGWVDLWREYIG